MKTITKISLAIGLVGVLLIGGLTYLATRPEKTAVPPVAPPEKPLVAQINDVRAKVGKPPLVEDRDLDQAALEKVGDQVYRNYWAHALPGEDIFHFVRPLYESSPREIHMGENLTRCGASDSARVASWVNSPKHYANMIGSFTRIGWAEEVNPKDSNCIYTVTEFSDY